MQRARTMADNAEVVLEIIRAQKEDGSYKVSLNDIEKFAASQRKRRNALVPQNYVYFHGQNSVGSTLIGFYANGSSLHSKFEETQLRLSDKKRMIVDGINI